MRVIKQLKTATDYWQEMVEPDYRECLDNPADLRAAFHAAISLFHMHDWIWATYKKSVQASFKVRKKAAFASALARQYPDFDRVRGIANSGKHDPKLAAKTQTRRIGGYFGGFLGNNFGRYYGHATIVVLEGTNGNDMKFSEVARAVYEMWGNLRTTHGW